MATTNWLSRALARSKVMTLTPGGTIEVGDIFIVTINGKSVSYSATGTTVASVCTGLAAALEASEIAEFAAITWTDSTTTVTATGPAGEEVTVTVSTTESNGGAADAQTFVLATTTEATGPNHWNDANNWSGGAVPVNSDTVNVDLALGSILYGVAQSAVTLAQLNIFSATQTQNRIGLSRINAGGWTEDQATYLAIGATACLIDAEATSIALDFGSVQNATEARRTGQSSDGVTPALLIKGTSAGNTFDMVEGSAGLAFYDGESYNATTVKAGPAATLIGGTGAAVTTLESLGETVWAGTFTDATCAGGTLDIRGSLTANTLEGSNGGQVIVRHTGTIAAVTLGCAFDASADRSARTWTDATMNPGGSLNDPNQTITITNGISLGLETVSLQAA